MKSADQSTTPPSGDSSLSWQIMHISYKIGYLQRTCDLILAAVQTAKSTAPPTTTPVRRFGRVRDRVAKITIHLRWSDMKRLYKAWREGPWGLLGLGLWGLAKFFGLL